MKLRSALFILLVFASLPGYVQTITQWRGAARNGIYQETNLLKSWPAEGPGQLWKIDSLGNGFASPVITADRIYVPGE